MKTEQQKTLSEEENLNDCLNLQFGLSGFVFLDHINEKDINENENTKI